MFTFLAYTDWPEIWLVSSCVSFPEDYCCCFAMVADDAADRSCGEQQRMIDLVLCISRRTFSLLIPVLSPVGSFCAALPVLHDCSLCNLQGAAIPRLAGRNCRRLGTLCVLCLCALTMAMTTPTLQVASRLPAVHPDVAQTLT
jgi:hypothetical protein